MLESLCVFFFQAEDGIRDLVRSRGLGDVYKRQALALLKDVELHLLESQRMDPPNKHIKTNLAINYLSLIHI